MPNQSPPSYTIRNLLRTQDGDPEQPVLENSAQDQPRFNAKHLPLSFFASPPDLQDSSFRASTGVAYSKAGPNRTYSGDSIVLRSLRVELSAPAVGVHALRGGLHASLAAVDEFGDADVGRGCQPPGGIISAAK